MAWKMDDKGNIEVRDSQPVWVGDDGTEVAFDAKANIIAAATAKREAAEARTKAKEAEQKLAAFAGIEDPAAALKALQFAGSMEGKKVMDDEGIKKLVDAALKPLLEENASLKTGYETQEKTIYQMKVSDKFNTSPFIKDKTIYGETPDVAEAYFSKHFKVVEGKTVAYDSTGSEIYSSLNAGKLADFDEAMSVLINSHPRKDFMLKSSGQSGTGSQQSNGTGGGNNPKVISRAVFATMNPAQQSAHALAGGQITD